MATSLETITYLKDQIGSNKIRTKKMFGEYALYFENVVIGLVCDNELFLKPTQIIKIMLPEVSFSPPYKGAKNWPLITQDLWEDHELLLSLIQKTYSEIIKK